MLKRMAIHLLMLVYLSSCMSAKTQHPNVSPEPPAALARNEQAELRSSNKHPSQLVIAAAREIKNNAQDFLNERQKETVVRDEFYRQCEQLAKTPDGVLAAQLQTVDLTKHKEDVGAGLKQSNKKWEYALIPLLGGLTLTAVSVALFIKNEKSHIKPLNEGGAAQVEAVGGLSEEAELAAMMAEKKKVVLIGLKNTIEDMIAFDSKADFARFLKENPVIKAYALDRIKEKNKEGIKSVEELSEKLTTVKEKVGRIDKFFSELKAKVENEALYVYYNEQWHKLNIAHTMKPAKDDKLSDFIMPKSSIQETLSFLDSELVDRQWTMAELKDEFLKLQTKIEQASAPRVTKAIPKLEPSVRSPEPQLHVGVDEVKYKNRKYTAVAGIAMGIASVIVGSVMAGMTSSNSKGFTLTENTALSPAYLHFLQKMNQTAEKYFGSSVGKENEKS